MTRLLEKLARWYFLHYLKPLCDTYPKAQTPQAEAPRKRYIGE